MLVLLFVFPILVFCKLPFLHSSFEESLTLETIEQDGKVAVHFHFQTTVDSTTSTLHTELFPKKMIQIIDKYDVSSLRLAFTQGRWRYGLWGNSKQEPIPSPSGVALETVFLKSDENLGNSTKYDEKWRGLVHQLSGLFCASLDFLDMTRVGYWSGVVRKDSHEKYFGALSVETVCTENFTPFELLVPADGFVSWINPLELYNNFYHSMIVKVTRTEQSIVLDQYITNVHDITDKTQHFKAFSVAELMGGGRLNPLRSPVASKSTVSLKTSKEFLENLQMVTPSSIEEEEYGDVVVYHYDFRNVSHTNFRVSFKGKRPSVLSFSKEHASPLSVRKYIKEDLYSRRQTMVIQFQSYGESVWVEEFFDMIPWNFRAFFHEMKYTVVTNEGEVVIGDSTERSKSVLKRFKIQVEQGGTISLQLRNLEIQEDTIHTFMFEVEAKILDVFQYPPDAHRGFDLCSTVVKYCLKKEKKECYDMYSEPLLVMVPTPDFSMPFNVMMLCCTLLSLFIGSFIKSIMKPNRWKLKVHVLETIENMDEEIKFRCPPIIKRGGTDDSDDKKKVKSNNSVSKPFDLGEEKTSVLREVVRSFFSTVSGNKKLEGKYFFKKYFNSSMKDLMVFVSKNLSKFIRTWREYKEVMGDDEDEKALLFDSTFERNVFQVMNERCVIPDGDDDDELSLRRRKKRKVWVIIGYLRGIGSKAIWGVFDFVLFQLSRIPIVPNLQRSKFDSFVKKNKDLYEEFLK